MTLESIPAETPYIDVAAIRRRKDLSTLPVLESSSRFKVGIMWAGSPTHRNDRYRSCPLRALLPVLHTPGIEFYSVQKGERNQELAQLPSEVRVQNLEPYLHDFGDLAVILDQLDLVITVDTSVAHVAGALGKPVWVLLQEAPDWRWGLAGETTPWYPTMRLFRQARAGDWTEVMARVVQALVEWQRQ